MSTVENYEQNRYCLDSDCAGIAEPQEEPQGGPGSVLRYYVCSQCDMEFGYELVTNPDAPGADGGACSLGIPESVRRVASVPPEGKGVFIGSIGRRPE